MLHTLTDWFQRYSDWVPWIGALSVALLALTLIATPWLLARLPADHFSRPETTPTQRSPGRLLWLLFRNVLGGLFLLLGLIMMITPGPGLVGLALGLSLCQFPGKQHLLRRFVGHRDVFRSLNWVRQRAGRDPFVHPAP